jgi:hypothetical protein
MSSARRVPPEFDLESCERVQPTQQVLPDVAVEQVRRMVGEYVAGECHRHTLRFEFEQATDEW